MREYDLMIMGYDNNAEGKLVLKRQETVRNTDLACFFRRNPDMAAMKIVKTRELTFA